MEIGVEGEREGAKEGGREREMEGRERDGRGMRGGRERERDGGEGERWKGG